MQDEEIVRQTRKGIKMMPDRLYIRDRKRRCRIVQLFRPKNIIRA